MPEVIPIKLSGVHPRLVAEVLKILEAMKALGFPMIVTDGLRTLEQQQALFAKGRTAPGPIVTRADGVKNKSNHQAKDDGFGHAVDCAFLVNDKASWDDKLPWSLYAAMARSLGLTAGADWPNFPDRPHIELKRK